MFGLMSKVFSLNRFICTGTQDINLFQVFDKSHTKSCQLSKVYPLPHKQNKKRTRAEKE